MAALAPSALAVPQDLGEDQDLTTLDLEQLMEIEVTEVYGASRRLQSTLDAPASVTVVTREQIRAQGYRTLGELLRGVPGFHTSYDRNYDYVGVRGFLVPGDYNSRVLCLVDGHRMNDPVYGNFGLGFDSAIDLDSVDRVEIVRGPGSALYGSNAVFAVINLVTRGADSAAGAALDLEGGEHDAYLARARVGERTADDDFWWVSTRGWRSHGAPLHYDEFAGTLSGGTTHDTDHESAAQVQARWQSGEWALGAGGFWREKGIPTGSYDTVFDDPDNVTTDMQGFLDLSWRRQLGEGRDVVAHVGYDDYLYEGVYVYDDTANGGPPDLQTKDRGLGRTLSGEVQYDFAGAWDDRVTCGAEARWNLALDQKTWDDLYGTAVESSESSFDWSLFAQDEFELARATRLVAGLRFDHLETSGGNLSPRLALVRQLDESNALKLLVGRAFRAPNAYELYYGDGVSQLPNPDLDPEEVATYELAYEGAPAPSWHVQASLFHYAIQNLIAQTVDPNSGLLVFENSDDVSADGLELGLGKTFESGLSLRFGQSFQQVEDDTTGERPANSPNHLTQLQVESPLGCDTLLAGVELVYVGSRGTLGGDSVDPYLLTNLQLRSTALGDGLELSLRAYNLFGVSYSDPVSGEFVQDSLRQDGLRLSLGLRLSR